MKRKRSRLPSPLASDQGAHRGANAGDDIALAMCDERAAPLDSINGANLLQDVITPSMAASILLQMDNPPQPLSWSDSDSADVMSMLMASAAHTFPWAVPSLLQQIMTATSAEQWTAIAATPMGAAAFGELVRCAVANDPWKTAFTIIHAWTLLPQRLHTVAAVMCASHETSAALVLGDAAASQSLAANPDGERLIALLARRAAQAEPWMATRALLSAFPVLPHPLRVELATAIATLPMDSAIALRRLGVDRVAALAIDDPGRRAVQRLAHSAAQASPDETLHALCASLEALPQESVRALADAISASPRCAAEAIALLGAQRVARFAATDNGCAILADLVQSAARSAPRYAAHALCMAWDGLPRALRTPLLTTTTGDPAESAYALIALGARRLRQLSADPDGCRALTALIDSATSARVSVLASLRMHETLEQLNGRAVAVNDAPVPSPPHARRRRSMR